MQGTAMSTLNAMLDLDLKAQVKSGVDLKIFDLNTPPLHFIVTVLLVVVGNRKV
jgi:hypothetical protein